MTPEQCRAARALLNWSQQQLADASRISNATIRNFESGRNAPQVATLWLLKSTLEGAGVVFLADGELTQGGPGVRLLRG